MGLEEKLYYALNRADKYGKSSFKVASITLSIKKDTGGFSIDGIRDGKVLFHWRINRSKRNVLNITHVVEVLRLIRKYSKRRRR